MTPLEIKKDIFWVGAVDFDNRDFHGYSLSPQGSTYNAYLIKDEKNVLFDTVSAHCATTLLCRLAKVLPPERVDYIVCNHLEPDHAGALKAVVERCKPEKIFCSKLGLQSMAGYFDISNWPVQVVSNGEEICIGKRTITFVETRMLHWPDSMVSYIKEDRLLISNDAFGQNIASTERFADQWNPYALAQAVKEYYYNIVLPYSPQVLKVLPLVESLDIDMIAPDHGLIHRGQESVRLILDMYRTLAEQKPQKRAVIIYDTMWHSTEKMAAAIISGLEEQGVPVRLMSLKENHHSAVMSEIAQCGAVIVGSPTHNNTYLPLVGAMLTYMKGLRPQNRIGGAFGSFGWSGEAPKQIYEWLSSMGWDMPVDALRQKWSPDMECYKAAHAMGATIAKALIAKCEG
ncbi:MAG: FprA family A-type flavoprotein [Desulfovibrionaceae bacterium]|nr:FprA family A-type flavoprotein [Desulfovibrionaceae bacterium]